MAQFSPSTKRPKAGANAAGGRRADMSWIGSLVGGLSAGAEPTVTPEATNYMAGGYTGPNIADVTSQGVAIGGNHIEPEQVTPAQTSLYGKPFNPQTDNLYTQPTGWRKLVDPQGSRAIQQANLNAKTEFSTGQMANQANNAQALNDLRVLAAQSGFDDPDEQEFAAQLALKQLGSKNVLSMGAGNASNQYQQGLQQLAVGKAQLPGIEGTSRSLQQKAIRDEAETPSAIPAAISGNELTTMKNTAAGTLIPAQTKQQLTAAELGTANNVSAKQLVAPQTALTNKRLEGMLEQYPSESTRRLYDLSHPPTSNSPYEFTLDGADGYGTFSTNPNAADKTGLGALGGAVNYNGAMMSPQGRVIVPRVSNGQISNPAPNQITPPVTSFGPQTSGRITTINPVEAPQEPTSNFMDYVSKIKGAQNTQIPEAPTPKLTPPTTTINSQVQAQPTPYQYTQPEIEYMNYLKQLREQGKAVPEGSSTF